MSKTTNIEPPHCGAILAPDTVNTSNRLARSVIDPHCHIYNATDWQVAGALRGPLAYQYKWPVRQLLQCLAGPVEKISRHFSLSAKAELEQLESWERMDAQSAREAMGCHVQNHLEWLAEQLACLLWDSDLEKRVNTLLRAGSQTFTRGEHRKFGAEFLLDAFDFRPRPGTLSRDQRKADATGLLSVPGLFTFLRHIMSPRFSNLLEYRKGFATEKGALGVDMCFASILDFDYWIGDDNHAPSRLVDQIDLMEKISCLSDGYMKPIVAYNPWTDIEDDCESIRMVETAVRDKGFIGVKIYPQLGYYPNRNVGQDYPSGGRRPADLHLLDKKLRHFFDICRNLDVPVMTHSEESMGQLRSHRKLGGPKAWTTFFESGHNADTRVNLAHMGGELGGGRGSRGWTQKFAKLMKSPNARYLYGDFGLWDELVGRGSRARQARRRIISLLAEPVSNHETVADRFMFGTDWFMLTFAYPNPDYVFEFQKTLEDANVEGEILDKIFFQNAERLFKVKCKP